MSIIVIIDDVIIIINNNNKSCTCNSKTERTSVKNSETKIATLNNNKIVKHKNIAGGRRVSTPYSVIGKTEKNGGKIKLKQRLAITHRNSIYFYTLGIILWPYHCTYKRGNLHNLCIFGRNMAVI